MADDNFNLALRLSGDSRDLSAALNAASRDVDSFAKRMDQRVGGAYRAGTKEAETYARGALKVEEAQNRVVKASAALATAEEKYGKDSRQARVAANDLAQAKLRVGTAARSAAKDTDTFSTSLRGSTLAARAAQGVALGVGYRLAKEFIEAGKATLTFDKNMRNVTSLMTSNGFTAEQLEGQYRGLSNGILDIAGQLPQSLGQLSDGLYEVVSSGIPAANALNVLNASAKAASAGLSDANTSTNAITGVMNAYGASAGSASEISDVLFQTVNLGVISFSQLAQNIGDVVGLASAAKVPIQDVGAAIAAMTRAGIVPAEASTSLNRLIQQLIEPSETLTRVYKSMGIESGAAELQTKGLYGVMEELRGATGGTATSVLSLFDDIRAARGAFGLMSNEGKTYAETQGAIANANARTGATERALSEQRKSVIYQLQQLRNSGEIFAVGLERDLEPALLGTIHLLSDVTRFATDNKTVVEALVLLYGVRFVSSLGAVRGAASALATTVTGLYASTVRAGTGFTVLGATATAEMTAASRASAGLGAAGSRALAAFGGPLMLAATVGVTGLAFVLQEALKKEESFADSISRRYDLSSQKGLQDAMEETKRKIAETEQAQRRLQEQQRTGAADPRNANRATKEYANQSRELTTELENLKKKQEEVAVSSGDVGAGMAQLTGKAESAAASVKAFEDAQKALREEFENWATPSTAFQSALSDAQDALTAASKAANQSTKSNVKEQKNALNEQYKAELNALQAQKENVSNRRQGGTDAINQEINDLKRRHQAQVDDLSAQSSYTAASNANSKSIADTATVGIDAYIRKLKEQDDALAKFQDNLVKIAKTYGLEVATQLSKLGPDAAGLIQEFANTTGPKAAQARDEIMRNLSLTAASADVETAMNLAAAAAVKGADAVGSGAVKALQSHTGDLLRVAGQYGIDLTKAADPVLDALGLKKINTNDVMGPVAQRDQTLVVKKADGGFEPGQPAIAPGGANVIWWAEPETQGESYIPHAPSKRARSVGILAQTADLFGLDVVDPRDGGHARHFADGGITTKLPFPPRIGAYPAAFQAQAVVDAMYVALDEKLKQITPGLGGGEVGSGWQAVTNFLGGQHVPFNVTSTTGGGHAKNSLHYQGKAVDLVSSNMMQIYNTLFSVGKNLQELIYSPAGIGIKRGQPVDIKSFYGDAVYKQHFNHVHAATYDSGGYLPVGPSIAVNNTGRPEPVIPAAHLERLVAALESGDRGNVSISVSGDSKSVAEVARQTARKVKPRR